MQLRLNTREVSQLDGLPVSLTQRLLGDPIYLVRVLVRGYQASMLFPADEVVEA
jgi:hypothetical protein